VAGPPEQEDWWQSQDAEDSSADAEDVLPPSSTDDSETANDGKVFKNVGLETWTQVRRAWLGQVPAGACRTRGKLPPYPAKSTRREIKRGISLNREFNLKRKVALVDLIEIYNEVWHEEDIAE